MSMTKTLTKPVKLSLGDTVAAVCHSWGGAATFPHRYLAGKQQLEKNFGVRVIEAPHTFMPAEELSAHPELRAQDIMWAFKNPDMKAVISVIGGDDAIRLLPYLDYDVIAQNPKIFMGYSDATVIHFACLKAGISSIYGPTIMAGFGENGGLFEYMTDSVKRTLFSTDMIGNISPHTGGWTDDASLSWANPDNQMQKRALRPPRPWRVLQGTGKVQGHLIGGCVEVLEMLKGTVVWPEPDMWSGAILFLETSEEAPSQDYFIRCLRNYAATGILKRLNGIILGRPAGLKDEELHKYDEALLRVVRDEAGLTKLPVLAQMDFGHTDPMFLIPYGAIAEMDCDTTSFSILDNAVEAA